MEYSNTYAKIDLDAIWDNFHTLQRRANAPAMAVVKADAYGHGAVPVAKLLEKACAWFGVSSAAEALELRQAGIQTPILILSRVLPETFSALVAEEIRPTVFTLEDARALSEVALRQGKTAKFHIAVDTGMSRIGVQVTEEDAQLCLKMATLPGLEAEGLFSHFATADGSDLTRAKAQADLFAKFDRMLRSRGLSIPLRHLDNTAGIMRFGCQYDMARAGISMYGLYPSEEVEKSLFLRPAMSWYARVSHVKILPAGREISYGGCYRTTGDTRVATISAGYADGYRRSLSGSFYVLIRGYKAPILGRICMDQFMVDVTHIPAVAPGDEVVLMGRQGKEEISAETLGAAANSFNYEQVCNVGRRVARVYYRQGEEVARVNYLR